MKDHGFYKKWIKLDSLNITHNKEDIVGYMQIDLSIVSKYTAPMPVVIVDQDYDLIEK